jgi:surfeit locus 1 family protein
MQVHIARYRFTPSLVPSLVFVVVFAALISLGLWQLDRAQQKQQALSARSARAVETAVDLNNRLALGAEDRYRAARASGRYLANRHWLLDNRVLNGEAGYHVFTLFALDGPGDRVVAVNRGWVGVGASRDWLPPIDTPRGRLTLRGRLDRPASVGLKLEVGELAGVAPAMVVQHLDLADLAAALGRNLLPYALVLDEGQPGLLRRDWAEKPGITPEKHLGYAVQWFGLALALLIIYVGVNTRRAGPGEHDEQPNE